MRAVRSHRSNFEERAVNTTRRSPRPQHPTGEGPTGPLYQQGAAIAHVAAAIGILVTRVTSWDPGQARVGSSIDREKAHEIRLPCVIGMDRLGWPLPMSGSGQQPVLFSVDQPMESHATAGPESVRAAKDMHACARCRRFRRKCDSLKPTCGRCAAAGAACSRSSEAAASSAVQARADQSLAMKGGADSEYDTRGSWGISAVSLRQAQSWMTVRTAVGWRMTTRATWTSRPPKSRSRGPAKKKRARLCLSCIRCHRLKVKCDKGKPCSRCVKAGLDNDCSYMSQDATKRHSSLLQSPSAPFTSVGEMPTGVSRCVGVDPQRG